MYFQRMYSFIRFLSSATIVNQFAYTIHIFTFSLKAYYQLNVPATNLHFRINFHSKLYFAVSTFSTVRCFANFLFSVPRHTSLFNYAHFYLDTFHSKKLWHAIKHLVKTESRCEWCTCLHSYVKKCRVYFLYKVGRV